MIDASIYNQLQVPKAPDPLEKFAQFQQAGDILAQSRLADLAYGEKERGLKDEEQAREAIRQSGGDMDKASNAVLGTGNYKQAMAMKTAMAAQQKAKIESALKQFEVVGQIMTGVKDQQSYDMARQQIAQIVGPQAATSMQPNYDPARIEQNRLKAMSVKDQLEAKHKELTLTETGRHNRATEELTLSGQDKADVRARENQKTEQNKPPSGYAWGQKDEDGQPTLVRIKGGPADEKVGVKAEKEALAANSSVDRSKLLIGTLDDALAKTGFFTTGLTGAVGGKIPGTTAYDLRSTIDTVKANIGFSELNAMRQASPTGGALGQVAVKELDMLQATLGNLDANQSQAVIKQQLEAVKKHYNNWKAVMEKAGYKGNVPEQPAVTDGAFADAEKERRYQEWKAKQK